MGEILVSVGFQKPHLKECFEKTERATKSNARKRLKTMRDFTYAPEGFRLSNGENREYISSYSGLERAIEKRVTLESTALLCDKDMNLHIALGDIVGIMPREEVQYCRFDEEVKDIAVLTRVGRPICFKVIGFTRDEFGRRAALLSRRLAQQECFLQFVADLRAGDVVPAKVTHMENFGAFVDIGCGIVSLLSIDCISVSRIAHPRERFSIGENLSVVIKQIDDNGRIFVSHRELLGTWTENAACFSAGQTVVGIVRSLESYGIFVELTPNLAGLAELKGDVAVGHQASVYIKNIIPEKMKIKLIIIDSHIADASPRSFSYFMTADNVTHIDRWRYSPSESERVIETLFDT